MERDRTSSQGYDGNAGSAGLGLVLIEPRNK
jgi:hypothetical protein